jgi:Helix-turn-helix domain
MNVFALAGTPMTRRQKEPLRALTEHERAVLQKMARSYSEPATCVLRAKALLLVASGLSYTQTAAAVGVSNLDTVSHWVQRFNTEGLAALVPHLPPGRAAIHTPKERQRILDLFATLTWPITMAAMSIKRSGSTSPLVGEGESELVEIPLMLSHGHLFA